MNSMKKIFTVALLALMLVIMCSCQKNPGEPSVVSKNNGRFDANLAVSSTEEQNPDTMKNVRLSESFFSTDGSVNFRFNIDQAITGTNLAVVEVIPHYLTEDDAIRVANVLFGEAVAYERDPILAPIYSQSEIQDCMVRWAPFAQMDNVRNLYGENDDFLVERVKGVLEEFNMMYEEAPAENPHDLCGWKFKKEAYYTYAQAEAEEKVSDMDNDAIMARYTVNGVEYCYDVVTRNQSDYKLNMISAYFYAGSSPLSMDERIFTAQLCRTMEPTEAQITNLQNKAMDMLMEMNLGEWTIDECYVETLIYGDTAEYVVCISAVPQLCGITAVRQPQLTNLKSETSYASNYYMTEAHFQFSANGDLVSFTMTSPIEIKQVVNENVKVMEIGDLLELAKAHLTLSDLQEYGIGWMLQWIDEELLCNIEITQLNYGLLRVKVPNADESYYYVPGFTLSGSVEYIGRESGDVYYTSDEPQILVAINAIDGSVVELYNE